MRLGATALGAAGAHRVAASGPLRCCTPGTARCSASARAFRRRPYARAPGAPPRAPRPECCAGISCTPHWRARASRCSAPPSPSSRLRPALPARACTRRSKESTRAAAAASAPAARPPRRDGSLPASSDPAAPDATRDGAGRGACARCSPGARSPGGGRRCRRGRRAAAAAAPKAGLERAARRTRGRWRRRSASCAGRTRR